MIGSATKAIVCGVLILTSCRMYSQERRPGIGINPDTSHRNFSALSFDKSLDTYHWNGTTFYKNLSGPLFLQLNEQFFSTLIRTDRKLITDNQLFGLHLRHRLMDGLQAASKVSSYILSDNKSIGISNASSHAFYGGVAYQPIESITIEPLLGIRLDDQIDQHDRGLSWLLGVQSDRLDLNGYLTRLSGSFQYDRLSPRVLETHNASVNIGKVFFEQTRNLLQLMFYKNRRDFYVLADTSVQTRYGVTYNIETRSDNAFTFADSISYNIGERFLLGFQGNILTREISRSTKYGNLSDPRQSSAGTTISELRIDGSASAAYALSDNFNAGFTLSYLERDEKHAIQPEVNIPQFSLEQMSKLEGRKDNHSRRTSMASEASLMVSKSDTLNLSGSGSILRYDTPSMDNDDDRDELWYIFSLSTGHRINGNLSLHFKADMSLTHVVYILSTRSADNNWNRIIRFAPRIEYSPLKGFTSANTFEVLANYTVYDFDYAGSPTRSFVFRQFAFIDSSDFALTSRLALEWFSHIRLYERGELRWDSFSEHPVNYFEDKTCVGSVRYSFSENLLFSIGIRYFSQLRFGYDGDRRFPESFLRSIGPTARIHANINGRTDLLVSGWYERQAQTAQSDRGFTTILMQLNVRI